MARPKGSKNKAKVLDGIDYTAQIAEKNTAAESIAIKLKFYKSQKTCTRTGWNIFCPLTRV